MKRILFLLVAITAFSCSSDDSTPVLEPNQFINGTWVEIAVKTDPNDDWVYTDCGDFQLSHKYTFNSDGTYTMVNGCDASLWPQVNGTYSIEGNVLTINNSEGQSTSYLGVVSSSQITKQDFSDEFEGEIYLLQKQ